MPEMALVSDGDFCWFAMKVMAGKSDLQIVQLIDFQGICQGFQVLQGGRYIGNIDSDNLAFEPKMGWALDAATSVDLKALLRKWRPVAQPAIEAGKRAVDADRRRHEAEIQKWRDEAKEQ